MTIKIARRGDEYVIDSIPLVDTDVIECNESHNLKQVSE